MRPTITNLGTLKGYLLLTALMTIAAGLFAQSNYVSLDASDNSSYPGSGTTWFDLSGQGNDFTLIGAPTFNTGNGGFLEFDGTGNQYCERAGFYGSAPFIGSSSASENWNGNSTYEAWVNPQTLSTGDARLVFGDGNNNEGVIDFRSDRIRAWNSTGIIAEYVAPINTDEWYHVAMTHEKVSLNNYEVKLFLNGALVATGSGTTADGYYGPDNALRIGYNWDGGIAQAKVFNYLLSDTEISDSYDADKNQFCHVDYTATVPAGSGTSQDPYQIASFENLLWLSKESDYWGQIFVQTADIDASVTSEACFNDGKGWSPIGNDAINFTGRYNGGNYTISNLFIDRPTQRYVGLFGKCSNVKLTNLNLEGTITADWDAGLLVGHITGGLIQNVHGNVNLTARESGGGLVGFNQCNIRNSSVQGVVIGSASNLGGLVGTNSGGGIFRCFASVDVSTSHALKGQVGGLVGAMLNAGTQIADSYATGSVSAQANSDNGGAGGLIGRISTTDPQVTNCYAVGTVSATGGPIGGLIGYNADGTASNVSDSFWDSQTTGQASSAGGTAKTTSEMQNRNTFFFADWDLQCETFNGTQDYWGLNTTDNSGYPFLSWQGFVDETVVVGTVSADQQVCGGDSPENITLSGSIGNIQWQSSASGTSFIDVQGANADVLDLQSLGLTEDRYYRAIVSNAGCNEISDTVFVEFLPGGESTLDVVACDSYTAPDGQEYGEDGQYIAVIPTAGGCDSTITINLTMLASIEVSVDVEACESYTAPDGAVYTTSGQYLATLPRANGCDSLITINLEINEPTSHTIYPVACNSYIAPDGQVFTSSGIYTIGYTNSAGCDSTLFIDLTVNNTNTSVETSATPATIGFANGAATVSVSGDQGPYEIQWNDPFMQTTPTAWGVFPGWYTCVITDASDCEMQIEVYVPLYLGVPNTSVSVADCNTVDRELNEFVSCESVQNADAYRWKFIEQGGPALPEFTRLTSRYIRLQWVAGLEYGKTYDVVVKALVDGDWGSYGDTCSIAIAGTLPTTEVRSDYHPTNAAGQSYALCDFTMAYHSPGASDYRWRFDADLDPDNGNELLYTRGSANPSLRLSWVPGIVPGNSYFVSVQAEFDGNWSDFGTAHEVVLANVEQPELRSVFCGQTYAPNGYVLSGSVCEADFYEFEFEALSGGALHTVVSGNYVALFNNVEPALSPGDYNVRVRVSQGGVLGAFGNACQISIAGAGFGADFISETRSVESTATAKIFPNPVSGEKVWLQLEELPEEPCHVTIDLFDIFGQHISGKSFGHGGGDLTHHMTLSGDLAKGMYLVQVKINEKDLTTERLIIR